MKMKILQALAISILIGLCMPTKLQASCEPNTCEDCTECMSNLAVAKVKREESDEYRMCNYACKKKEEKDYVDAIGTCNESCKSIGCDVDACKKTIVPLIAQKLSEMDSTKQEESEMDSTKQEELK